jgi:membrane protein implicated in regulation of membrane protease activity
MDYMPYVWAALIVALLFLEGITAQIVSIWFVFGALAAFIVSLIAPGSITLQVVLFLVLSMITLIAARPFVSRILLRTKAEPTNADRVIGQTAIVTQEINNGEGVGLVSVAGQIWSARTVDQSVATVGTVVQIMSIQGVKLMVLPVKSGT